ncbi:hypothetical protein K435DRAFT_422894 [Dendrothele bispora CBS 962.96]|uniref:Uncharacterized protein n=1 Tax=Dendrothele bispora (strain CBS 962.96) TaxID=1314807 RepID=A0A4S8MF99_DENBC|nr:hypothetical protein K435DRAFT_422894 [Dendrothele bispora CBS 962.96]
MGSRDGSQTFVRDELDKCQRSEDVNRYGNCKWSSTCQNCRSLGFKDTSRLSYKFYTVRFRLN